MRIPALAVWSVAVAFVGLLLSVANSLDQEARRTALESAQSRVASAADNAEASVNRFLLGIDVLLSTLASAENKVARDSALSLLAKSQLAVRDLVLLDPDGSVVAAALPVTQRLGLGLPVAVRQEVLGSTSPTLAVSTPTESFATSETIVYFARRLPTPWGTNLIAVAAVPAAQVQASLGDPRDGFTLMLQRYDGQVLVAAPQTGLPESALVSRAPVRPSPDGHAQLAKGGLDGRDAVVAARALVHPGLLVAVSVAESTALAPWKDARRANLLAVGFLCSLVLGVAALAHIALARMQSSTSEIAQTKQWLSEAIESVPEGILLCDADERVVAWNTRYLDIYPWLSSVIRPGVPHEQLVQLSVKNLFATASDEQQADLVRQRLAVHRLPGAEFEHQIGDEMTIQVTERRTPAGGTVSVFRDITGTERELNAARQAARAARRASERFVVGVKDELQVTAASLLSMIERTAADPALSRTAASLEGARREAQELLSDIVDLHELFLLEDAKAPQREAVHLPPLLMRATQHAQSLASTRRISVNVVYRTEGFDHVLGDSRRLAQLAYSALKAVVSAAPAGANLRAVWSVALSRDRGGTHHRLRLDAFAARPETAAAIASVLSNGGPIQGRPRTATRLTRRLADLLDGDLVVADPRGEPAELVLTTWVRLLPAHASAEAAT